MRRIAKLYRYIWSVLLITSSGIVASELPCKLQPSFGEAEDEAAARVLLEWVGADTADAYRGMDETEKAHFLNAFWGERSPLLHKYYYGYHLGARQYSVSEAFFERDGFMPRRFWTQAMKPDRAEITEAIQICEQLRAIRSDDPVVLCALGYLHLEQRNEKIAEKMFLKAISTTVSIR